VVDEQGKEHKLKVWEKEFQLELGKTYIFPISSSMAWGYQVSTNAVQELGIQLIEEESQPKTLHEQFVPDEDEEYIEDDVVVTTEPNTEPNIVVHQPEKAELPKRKSVTMTIPDSDPQLSSTQSRQEEIVEKMVKKKQPEEYVGEIIEEGDFKDIDVPPDSDRFAIAERSDEDQIITEIKGSVIKDYVYKFKQGNKTITGLAYAGVKRIVTKMGGISIVGMPEFNIPNDRPPKMGEYIECTIKVHDKVRDLDGIGMGDAVVAAHNIRFVKRIVLSKAIRNAWRSIIDEALAVTIINEWMEKHKK
jgi:hypothetical protein